MWLCPISNQVAGLRVLYSGMESSTGLAHTGLLTDLYELNMAYAYWKAGMQDVRAVFDLFFRNNPCDNGFSVASGLADAIDYIVNWHFSEEDLAYLKDVYPYDERFLDLLRSIRFTGDVRAIEEGSVVFPGEPLMRVTAPLMQAQLLESALLSLVNHQTLIATKAARMVEAAGNSGAVIEFGLRRAHGPQAGTYGARAAYVGGAAGTSNVLAGKLYGIPISGTHAHSFVQSFSSEIEAFRVFAREFPTSCTLLIDTYDTLNSGLPHAITVFKEQKEAIGDQFSNFAVRLDSGDLAYLSKECRQRLDAAGLKEARIIASNDLDEYVIRDLLAQGARIDGWGVGTSLITSRQCPALGGVYKLVAIEKEGQFVPRIKISENAAKIVTPGVKKVVRFSAIKDRLPLVDLIMLEDEPIPTRSFEAFDPLYPWKRKMVSDFEPRSLHQEIFRAGELVYAIPELVKTRQYSLEQRALFPAEVRRLVNPHEYHVDLSQKLWDLRENTINQTTQHRPQV